MTLAMDPRDRTRMPQVTRLLSVPRRPLWLIGAGSLGLVAFTYGAFAFFGDLADPRARTPRPRMPPVASAAVTMPDLARDGVPVLAPASTSLPMSTQPPVARPPEPSAPAAVSLRSEREEAPAIARETPVARETPFAPEAPKPPRTAEPASEPAARRANKPAVAIETAPVVKPEVRQAAVIAPLRLSTPIAPAKAETVRAKLAEERPAAPSSTPPAPDAAAKRASAVKPPRERPVRAASADAAPAVAAAPARSTPHKAEPEDDDIGTKIGTKFTSGIKAIGGLLTGD